MFAEAARLIDHGTTAPLRVRQIVRAFQRSPGDKFSQHDVKVVTKFTREATKPKKAVPKAKGVMESRVVLVGGDREIVEQAVKRATTEPPVDVRVRDFLATYRKRRTSHVGRDTMDRLRRYVAQPRLEPRAAQAAPKDLGLGLAGVVEHIGPEEALEMLAIHENTGFRNRIISKERVTAYADEMKAGRWRLTGEPVIVGKDGRLMNGQHRIYAVLDSEQTIPFVVIRGVPDDAYYAMDQGKARRAADVIGTQPGVRNRAVVAAALKMLFVWDSKGPERMVDMGRRVTDFSNETAIEMLRAEPGIVRSATYTAGLRHLAPPSAAAFCHYLCSRVAQTAADEFFDRLATGENMVKGEALYTLRQRLIADRAEPNMAVKTMASVRMILRAWNAWRRGEKLTKMPSLADTVPQRPV